MLQICQPYGLDDGAHGVTRPTCPNFQLLCAATFIGWPVTLNVTPAILIVMPATFGAWLATLNVMTATFGV